MSDWRCAACTLENVVTAAVCASCGASARSGGFVSGGASTASLAAAVPEVAIDHEGVFKYILISVDRRVLVRGHAWATYHDDLLQHYRPSLPGAVGCLGGGRIAIDADLKQARVYGYSVGYGRANHAVTAAALARAFPGFRITHDDEGY